MRPAKDIENCETEKAPPLAGGDELNSQSLGGKTERPRYIPVFKSI